MKQEKCRVCGEKELEVILDLGNQPWCNDYKKITEIKNEIIKYPLRACFCNKCSTFQIDENVSPSIMYGDHTYRTASNKSMTKHFDEIAEKVNCYFTERKGLVMDIGSNDGTLLKSYKKLGWKVLGIEPSKNTAEEAKKNGIETLNEFFDYTLSSKIKNTIDKAMIISAANVLYHIENIHEVLKGVKNILDERGIFVIQATYLPNLIENNEYDIIYHEHLLYYRIETLNLLLNMHGLEVFDCSFAHVHGGSAIIYANHKNTRDISENVKRIIKNEQIKEYSKILIYKDFAKRVEILNNKLKQYIELKVSEGYKICAYGAPAKGTVLINTLKLDSKCISYAVEVNKEKFNTYIPGTDIKVIDEQLVRDEEPDYYLLLSWNFLEEFKKNEKFINAKRKFIVPFPEPHVVSLNKIEYI